MGNLTDVLLVGALGFALLQVPRVRDLFKLTQGIQAPGVPSPQTPTAPLSLAQATNALQVTGGSWLAVDSRTELWHAHAEINHHGNASDGGIFAVFLVGAWAAGSFLGQSILQGDWQTVAQQDLTVGPDPEWTGYSLELRGPGPSGPTATALARLVIQDLDGNVYDTRDIPAHWGTD